MTSDLPHEIAAVQQQYNQDRVANWVQTGCPILGCERYSPNALAIVKPDQPLPLRPSLDPILLETSHSASPNNTVHIYPSQPVPHQHNTDLESSTFSSSSSSAALLDVRIEKILRLIERESSVTFLHHQQQLQQQQKSLLVPTEPSSPLSRQVSKKRRETPRSITPTRSISKSGSSSSSGLAYNWTFKRDLYTTLECDVCAQLLVDPISTPCQHVSYCFSFH